MVKDFYVGGGFSYKTLKKQYRKSHLNIIYQIKYITQMHKLYLLLILGTLITPSSSNINKLFSINHKLVLVGSYSYIENNIRTTNLLLVVFVWSEMVTRTVTLKKKKKLI